MSKQNIRKKHPVQSQKSKATDKNEKLKKTIYFILSAIVLLTIIVFSNSLKNNFISNWDDDVYILNNTDIKDINLVKFGRILHTYYNSNYHPLVTLYYAFEYNVFGMNSVPFHLSNLLFHLMNVCLVFYFIFLLTKKTDVAAIVSVLFAIHPMHVESVSWIAERKDVLYAFFFLGSMIYYLKYIENSSKYKPLVISIILFLLSCFSKSMAVTLPLVLILIDYYLSRQFSKKLILEKIPFFIIAIIFGAVAFDSQSQFGSTNMAPVFPAFERIFLLSYSTMYYIVMLVFPVNLSAVHYYPINPGEALPVYCYLSLLAIVLIVLGVYMANKLKKEMIFGFLFFIITISLVIQLVPIGRAIVSERYSYVTYLGLFFIIGMFYNGVAEKYFSTGINKLKPFLQFAFVIYVLIFSYSSYSRNRVWKDGVTLFTDVIEKNPNISHPYLARAGARMNINDSEGALADYASAIKLNPGNAEAYNNRAVIENTRRQYDAAIADCKEAIRVKPDYPDAYNNYGVALANKRRYKEAIELYNKALKLNPTFFIAFDNRGFAKNLLKDFKGALTDCNIAISINPYYPEAYNDRGFAKQNLGDLKGALEDYTKTISLNPSHAKAYQNRAMIKYNSKDYQGAVNDFEKSLQLDSSNIENYYNIGVSKYYLNDMQGACENWRKAAQRGYAQAVAIAGSYCK
ncbi:MAG: tetratricopeptide repeat protein [Bacteroidales bacterium]|nr:tetratricopeptide repeat protein [Bacteroidales bacterium]